MLTLAEVIIVNEVTSEKAAATSSSISLSSQLSDVVVVVQSATDLISHHDILLPTSAGLIIT